jgi:hypothetical protein
MCEKSEYWGVEEYTETAEKLGECLHCKADICESAEHYYHPRYGGNLCKGCVIDYAKSVLLEVFGLEDGLDGFADLLSKSLDNYYLDEDVLAESFGFENKT